MSLYSDSGYVNIDYIISRGMTYNFVVGGRGTGKTYTALKYMIETGSRFIYMRRMQVQLDNVCTPDLSPFKPLNLDSNGELNVIPAPNGKNSYLFKDVKFDEDGNIITEDLMGYAIALSTVSNLRGFSAADVKYLIYDEFIPERHEKPVKNECIAFLNCIETINRNRELAGDPPVKVLCLANANDFANPLFVGLSLVKTVERMIETHREEYQNPQRGIGLYLLQDSPISKKKSETSLYKLAGYGEYSQMALENIFADYEAENIKPQPLNEYRPLVSIGELTIYTHKTSRIFYVTGHKSGSPRSYKPVESDIRRFKQTHKGILLQLILGTVYYESHFDKALLEKYLTMTR